MALVAQPAAIALDQLEIGLGPNLLDMMDVSGRPPSAVLTGRLAMAIELLPFGPQFHEIDSDIKQCKLL
jgi:hypothetical protein